MKKGLSVVIILLIAVAIVGGGYALMHKSKTPANTASSSNSNTVSSNAVLATKSNATLGQYLTEPNGQPLYTYGSDSNGVSNCTGACLTSWPAYQDKGSTTDLPTGVGTLMRSDNREVQFTYNGMPLYTFVSDRNGEATGNGVANFKVAKPVSSSSSTPATTPTNSTDTYSNSSSSW